MTQVRYRLVKGKTSDILERMVNELLSEGWKLHGSPFYEREYSSFCQAMVREVGLTTNSTAG